MSAIKFDPLEAVFEVTYAYQENEDVISILIERMHFFDLAIIYMVGEANIERVVYLPTGEDISLERVRKMIYKTRIGENFTLEG